MTDQNSQFFAILTAVGEAKQANANALGVPWTFAQMGVGDANNTEPVPSRTQTRLINERRRAALNQLSVDPKNASIIIAEQVIPPDEGGWWIREIGLYDAAGDLVAVANCAPSFKPLLSQGTGKTQVVRLNLVVTSTANVQLKIDPAVVLATRDYVDTAILSVLPKNKVAGTYTKIAIDERGIVQQGYNPTTLAGYGISDAYTKTQTSAAIQSAVNALVNGAGASLDTLQELAAALGNDANFSATVTAALASKAAKATTLAGYGIGDSYTSTQIDTALFAKAPKDSPLLTGVPTVLAIPNIDDSPRIASTRFVNEQIHALIQIDIAGSGVMTLTVGQAMPVIYLMGVMTGDRDIVLPRAYRKYMIANLTTGTGKVTARMSTGVGVQISRNSSSSIFTDLYDARLCQTDFISPTLTGTVSVPDVVTGTSNGQAANTKFVMTAIAGLVASSPAALDTLGELAAALGNDANFAVTMTNTLALKAALGSPAFSGIPTCPTAAAGTNTAQIASTAFVRSAVLAEVVPAGEVTYFASVTIPVGRLRANGAAVSRTAYPSLFAAIGTYYGSGDGATTFNLPDLRGEFIRGTDDGRGVDAGRGHGTWQPSQNQSHSHNASTGIAGGHTHAGSSIAAAGDHTHTFNCINTPAAGDSPGVGAGMHYTGVGVTESNRINAAGNHTHALTITADGWHSHTVTVEADGGSEVRVRNIALYPYIKY